MERHDPPARVQCRILFYNTFLVVVREFGITWSDVGAPDRKKRARRIGRRAAQAAFDVVALCEVFEGDDKDYIENHFKDNSPEGGAGVTIARGPLSEGAAWQTSGLFTIASERFPIVARRTHTFENRGNALLKDADPLANKGVLQVVVDPGLDAGKLEIYSTHLFAGGGLPISVADPAAEVLDRVAVERRNGVRRAQLEELLDFVRDTHDDENVAVIGGDFNISAEGSAYDSDEPPGLLQRMNDHGFRDVWSIRNGTPGYTSDIIKNPAICPPGRGEYCDDLASMAGGGDGARIDYLFVEDQRRSAQLLLDYSRPRRRPFWWDEAEASLPALSDHVGMELTLTLRPRSA
jgi:endonuclease/exonuclease/phosphatase family metal-dependent hydrolase